MARFLLKNKSKDKTIARKDVVTGKLVPHKWGPQIAILLEPGEEITFGGDAAEIAADQLPGLLGKMGFKPDEYELKELPDAGQKMGGEPIWVVVIKKEAIHPVTKEKIEFPYSLGTAGRRLELNPGPNELTEFCAQSVGLAAAWLVEKDKEGNLMIMPKADYEPPEQPLSEWLKHYPKEKREPFCEFANVSMDTVLTQEDFQGFMSLFNDHLKELAKQEKKDKAKAGKTESKEESKKEEEETEAASEQKSEAESQEE